METEHAALGHMMPQNTNAQGSAFATTPEMARYSAALSSTPSMTPEPSMPSSPTTLSATAMTSMNR